jgi:DNA-binding CsgD family transcriptional regulator
VSIGATATGPFGRPAGNGTRSLGRHAVALAAVGCASTGLELGVLDLDLDHGTHLLVVLTLVIGIGVLFGPRPAATGLVAGGAVAMACSVITVDRVLHTPVTYVQMLTYLLAGTASIVLVSALIRSRRQRSNPTPARPAITPRQQDLVEPLTARELEVLRLAATGVSVEEMARQLFVSPNTVKTHLTHVYAKLGVRGRSDAIRAALHCGCLTTDDICPHRCANGALESPIPVTPSHPNG